MSHRWWGAILATAAVSALVGCVSTAAPGPTDTTSTARTESVITANAWIAYQGLSDRGPDGIFLVRADGSHDHEILLGVTGRRLHPDFSPDGSTLAFDQSDGDVDRVYVANSDGSSPRVVAECKLPDCIQRWEPAWSPDGTRLAIATTTGGIPGTMGIAVVDVATGAVKQVVDHPQADGQDQFPRWSPDGTHLVFWRSITGGEGGNTAVYIVGADGRGLTKLTDDAMVAGDPDFSPDGTRILFGTHPLLQYPDAGQSDLYTMASDGSGVVQLTHFGGDGPRATQARWTPDGAAIIYIRTDQTGHPRHIYAMDAEGAHDGPVATAKKVYTHPILQPEH